jgi:hypothetical protein
VKGVSQVELTVDGQPIHVQKVEPPVNSFAANQPWTPAKSGSHVIELRAFNIDNEPSDPAQVFITVVEAGVSTTPQPGETPATPLPPSVEPTGGAVTLIPPGPTASQPAANQPLVTTLVGLNVRAGPGTDYAVIGRLPENQSVPITGRNSEGSWWQLPSRWAAAKGWISGSAQFLGPAMPKGAGSTRLPRPTPAHRPLRLLRRPVINISGGSGYNQPGDKITLLGPGGGQRGFPAL